MQILDVTIREAAYCVNHSISPQQTARIAYLLEEAGIQNIEIGFALGLGYKRRNPLVKGTDREHLEAAHKTLKKAKISVFIIPGIGHEEDLKLAFDYGVSIIRVGCNAPEYQKAQNLIETASKMGFFTSFNLMKSYLLKPKEISQIAALAGQWGAKVIYIVDSAGTMSAAQVQEYIANVAQIDGIKAGFHAHNNLGLAISNSLEAIKTGASFIDASISGIGRSAGNAQTELLVALLHRENLLKDIDLLKLIKLADSEIEDLYPYSIGVKGLDLWLGLHGLHSSVQPLLEAVAEECQVDLYQLIAAVAAVDQLNPSKELILNCARELQ